MIDDGLFELPVYTCTQEQLVEHVTAYVDRQMADVPDFGTGFWQQQRQEEIQRHLRPVRYNELVGCVEVYSLGTQLRAGLWFTDKKRIVFGSPNRGRITSWGKILEMHYDHSDLSSVEIFNDFRDSLVAVVKRSRLLKRRFVDFNAFDRCGPFVNWRAVLNLGDHE
jgi:hypothetical protein